MNIAIVFIDTTICRFRNFVKIYLDDMTLWVRRFRAAWVFTGPRPQLHSRKNNLSGEPKAKPAQGYL